ncbi:MAG: PP-loop domain protein [Leptospira sp.]|nr:PP-loop domain protein [Leptospira sp.]
MVNISANTESIFIRAWDRLINYRELLTENHAVIGYSGGKDSTLLLNFYSYLFQYKLIPEPLIYHLDHSIRDNAEQESLLTIFLDTNFIFKTFIKKKIFRR